MPNRCGDHRELLTYPYANCVSYTSIPNLALLALSRSHRFHAAPREAPTARGPPRVPSGVTPWPCHGTGDSVRPLCARDMHIFLHNVLLLCLDHLISHHHRMWFHPARTLQPGARAHSLMQNIFIPRLRRGRPISYVPFGWPCRRLHLYMHGIAVALLRLAKCCSSHIPNHKWHKSLKTNDTKGTGGSCRGGAAGVCTKVASASTHTRICRSQCTRASHDAQWPPLGENALHALLA